MGSYYYFKNRDLSDLWKHFPIPEEDVFRALRKIARNHGVKITDQMILHELGHTNKHPTKKRSLPKRYLYIDGTNLFAGQYDLFGPHKILSFRSIIKDIEKLYLISRIFFYASYAPRSSTDKSALFFSNEAQFYQDVRTTPKVNFYKGHRSPSSGKEKGVDVHFALDMVKDAFLQRYDEALIMTGDADLIYAVELVKQFSLPVHALFLPNRFSLEIAYKVDSSAVLNYKKRFKPSRKLPAKLQIIPIKSPTCKQVG